MTVVVKAIKAKALSKRHIHMHTCMHTHREGMTLLVNPKKAKDLPDFVKNPEKFEETRDETMQEIIQVCMYVCVYIYIYM